MKFIDWAKRIVDQKLYTERTKTDTERRFEDLDRVSLRNQISNLMLQASKYDLEAKIHLENAAFCRNSVAIRARNAQSFTTDHLLAVAEERARKVLALQQQADQCRKQADELRLSHKNTLKGIRQS
jgi:hypothetical protein